MPAAGVFNRITPAWAGKRFRRGKINTRTRDHPRVGGEKSLFYRFVILLVGSPPRGRGKGGRDRPFPHHPGITPAWAGKSGKNPKPLQRTRDHPRVGGEKFDFWYLQCNRLGSPPRGRGKVEIGNLLFVGGGITPAWARKSAIWKLPILPRKDHPRVGGEKRIWYNPLRGQGGSPPRGRGKVALGNYHPFFLGITPAWAGKSLPAVPDGILCGDHPRVGGEKVCAGLGMRKTMGSPPRWRGKDEIDIVVQVPSGITPALAGKSCRILRSSTTCGDHPRVGGEKYLALMSSESDRGSPPRWRGKDEEGQTKALEYGITPALAGKSPLCFPVFTTLWDHPRVGGEKPDGKRFCSCVQGSPPRWRGKAPPYRMRPVGGGITPALAGKSLHFSHFLGGGKDHPRVGGEKYGGPCVCFRSPGSPPRWRGKVHDQKLPDGARGITPAWAGKSCLADLFPAGRKDHPRVGGEKKTVPFEVGGGKGSPPRGRGKGILHPMHCPHGRITPAWAGKRQFQNVRNPKPWDHPRVGGEKTKKIP